MNHDGIPPGCVVVLGLLWSNNLVKSWLDTPTASLGQYQMVYCGGRRRPLEGGKSYVWSRCILAIKLFRILSLNDTRLLSG